MCHFSQWQKQERVSVMQTVTKFAEENSNCEVAMKYLVHESMVESWRKVILTSDLPLALSKRKRIFGENHVTQISYHICWTGFAGEDNRRTRETLVYPLWTHICLSFTNCWKHGIKDFQGTRGWLFRLLKHGNLSLRRRPTTGQTMSKDALSKVANFIKFYER